MNIILFSADNISGKSFKEGLIMKRRKKIRLTAFLGALTLTLTVWGASASIKAHHYKRLTDINNENALISLTEYMDSIETSLTKCLYASSPLTLGELTSALQRNTAGAKQSLAALSSGDTALHNTYKFLSQVGEFTASLNKKVTAGEKITEEERQTLKTLLNFSAHLSLQFEYMASLLSADYFTFDELSHALTEADTGSESTVSYLNSISDTEMTFEDYPSLIYDGPFSDNILTKESSLLADFAEISPEKAKAIAAAVAGVEERLLVTDEETGGRLAAYCFRTDAYTISVTKKGGFPLELISDITAGEIKLTQADAIEKAAVFLGNIGYYDMVSTYAAVNDGICTINFAYKQGSFVCYPDLIKVSVSMTDGKITGLEASDYIMNHTVRDIPEFSITPETAAESIPSSLRVKTISAAVIPTKSGGEKYTFELLCEDSDSRHILIYKDITTGEEADILILLYSDNGTLTK